MGREGKRCAFHHMLKDECSDEQKAVYTENGVTYDTRPIAERMSDGHPEAIQSAPQVESALGSPDVATTHKEVPNDTERKISQPEELVQEVRPENLVQSECHGIPGEIAPIPKDTDSTLWGETDCPGKPGPLMWSLLSLLILLGVQVATEGTWAKRVQLILLLRRYLILKH